MMQQPLKQRFNIISVVDLLKKAENSKDKKTPEKAGALRKSKNT